MRIRFLGHAAFLITTADGTKIVTDPYEPGGFGGAIKYGPLQEPADIVVVSHDHADHNYVQMVPGKPVVVKEPGEYLERGVALRSLSTYHDASRGAQRGRNTVWVIKADGLTLCHLGDLGEPLNPEAVTALGPLDVLMVPVGGVFTIDHRGATGVMNSLRPRLTIPMHYSTPKAGFNLASVEEFLAGKQGVRRVQGSEIEVSRDSLPQTPEVVVLQPAL
jgi:L-ascorbate metabolism protein UlaG (beta-lactamase superfamily)